MIPLRLDEVAALAEGRLTTAPSADEITGVKVDSRKVEPGDLFVALGRGADFLAEALQRGAAATLRKPSSSTTSSFAFSWSVSRLMAVITSPWRVDT